MRLQKGISVFLPRPSFRTTLKRLSVSRCPRDDMDRLRIPDDVPEEVWAECDWSHFPARRHFGPGRHDLRGGHGDEKG